MNQRARMCTEFLDYRLDRRYAPAQDNQKQVNKARVPANR